MSMKSNPNKKDGAVYISQKEASARWEEQNPQDKLIIRLPHSKYSTAKGRPSVNAMIRSLIENEIGRELN